MEVDGWPGAETEGGWLPKMEGRLPFIDRARVWGISIRFRTSDLDPTVRSGGGSIGGLVGCVRERLGLIGERGEMQPDMISETETSDE